jgi:hypothetical protein
MSGPTITFVFKLGGKSWPVTCCRSAYGLLDSESENEDPNNPDKSMLVTMARKRWSGATSSASTEFEIELDGETVADKFSPDCAVQIMEWHKWAGNSDNKFQLSMDVELEEFVEVCDFFNIDLDLDNIEIDPDAQFAVKVRAKLFMERRENVALAIADFKSRLMENASSVVNCLFLQDNDDYLYVTKSAAERFIMIADVNGYHRETRQKHYEWAQAPALREQFKNDLLEDGLVVEWSRVHVELSGTRGMEFASHETQTVHAHRWRAVVNVPDAEPPMKRARKSTGV